jgi:hypothetical protein
MLHCKKEGEIIRQGLSVYHPKDKSSAGFVLRIGNHILRVRWSKNAKKFFGGYNHVDPKEYDRAFGEWNK